MEDSSSPSNLISTSRKLLTSPTHEDFELLLNKLSSPEETLDFQSSLTLFNTCTNFPTSLTLTLLEIHKLSSNATSRLQSLHLLASTLDIFQTRKARLSQTGLQLIKPLLISCLDTQDTETTKTLGQIVSFVASSVDDGEWDELGDCILSFTKTQPLKAFYVFRDLPRMGLRFLDRFIESLVVEAEKALLSDDVESLFVGLETLVKLGVQILDSDDIEEWRLELAKIPFRVLVKSVRVLVKKGKEEFVVKGFESLERFLARDKVLYGYSMDQCGFVSSFVYKVREYGIDIMEVGEKVLLCVADQDFDRFCFKQLNELSFVDLVTIFVLPDSDERSKDMAIRRVNLILSDDNSMMEVIDDSVLKKLEPVLVSSLTEEGVSESMYKVLGEAVYRVANEMMSIEGEETWFGLRDYIIEKSETEFQRAVYVFQCLTMALHEEEFVVPVMDKLLPEISKWLEPPSEVLVDNSGWVLAFTGGFCAVVHLLEVEKHTELVKEIAYKMVDSVRELVEKGMEVGLVRRAFRDLESIVKKNINWFCTNEYRFVKILLRRLYGIVGMKWESKIVLWRINVVLEREVNDLFKELLGDEGNWLNQNQDEDAQAR